MDTPPALKHPVEHDPAVGIAERRVMGAVRDRSRVVPAAGSLMLHREPADQSAALLCLGEHVVADSDLSQDRLDHAVGGTLNERG